MPILKAPNGQEKWIERSQVYLPRGGKIFSFKLGGLFTVIGVSSLLYYGLLQSTLNPDSIYGRVYNNLSNYLTINRQELESKQMEEEEKAKEKKLKEKENKEKQYKKIRALNIFS